MRLVPWASLWSIVLSFFSAARGDVCLGNRLSRFLADGRELKVGFPAEGAVVFLL